MPEKISSGQEMVFPTSRRRTVSFKETLLMLYRRRRLLLALFLSIFLVVALVTMFMPSMYVAGAKILLKKERATTLVSPTEDASMVLKPQGSPEVLNSEIEILKSFSLLCEVARNLGLDRLESAEHLSAEAGRVSLVRAAVKLEKDLSIELIPKSNIIQVSYVSPQPALAAEVVNELCRRYVDHHLQMHENRGVYAFFQKQAQAIYDSLQHLEEELINFEVEHGLIEPEQQRALALQQLADDEARLNMVAAGKQQAAQKVKFYEQQLAREPQRIQAQARHAYNMVVTALKAEIDSLQHGAQEFGRNQPQARKLEARRVTPLSHQAKIRMAQLEEAILRQEIAPPQETAGDINRALMAIHSELTRARADLMGFRAQEKELLRAIGEMKTRLENLESAGHTHEALKRRWQLYQNNYALYSRKQEEARISEALDREKVANVSLIDSAGVPLNPIRPNRKLNLALGFVLALLVSVGTVFAIGYFDPAVQFSSDIERRLSVPVIATIPAMQRRPKLLLERNTSS